MQRVARYSAWHVVVLAVFVIFVVLTLVGTIAFPYAPLHQEGAQYLDKLGHPHTAEHYTRFRWFWERSFIIVGTVFALIAIGSAFHRYQQTGSFRIRPPRPNQAMQRTAPRSNA